jgi:hypothetical protein
MKSYKKWMVVPFEEKELDSKKTKDQEFHLLSKILEDGDKTNSEKLDIYNQSFKKILTKNLEEESNKKDEVEIDDQLSNVQNTINQILEKISENKTSPVSKRTRIGILKKANKLSPNIKNVLEKQIKNSIKEKEREKEQEKEREREQERDKEKSRRDLFKIKKNKRKEGLPKKTKKNLEILRNIDITPIKETHHKGEYNWEHDTMELDETSHL